MVNPGHYRQELAKVVAGRPWIVARDVLASCTNIAELLMELGASRVMCIGGTQGSGPLPDPEIFDCTVLNVSGPDTMSVIRAADRALSDLPAEVRAKVDAFDPEGQARVIGTIFSSGRPVADRPIYGARAPSWQALEDKLIIDDLWDRAGIYRAPREIVAADFVELTQSARRMDEGIGTVWVGDNAEGFHGAAAYLRWVRNDKDARAAADFFEQHCEQVRVMPFVEGISCSIHAFVFADEVIAFRPCEMVIFRRPDSNKLVYSRATTFWDPQPEDRDYMRSAVCRVGELIRSEVGYRGIFTLDGIMSAKGFVPTELNPRFGAAISTQAAALPDLPLFVLQLAVIENEALDYRAAELEKLLLDSAYNNRRGSGLLLLTDRVDNNNEADIVRLGSGWRRADEHEEPDASLSLGPGPLGSTLRVTLVPERTPIGPPAAPLIASALQFAGEIWNLDVGELIAAKQVR